MSGQPYTIVIGLEVHVQLLTKTKLFCRCETRFGEPPNTLTCPVCTGTPGALPVMNRKAFDLSLVTAVALNCEIPQFTKWDRKQYYYPDLPKGYQISQYDLPMSQNGYLEIDDPAGGEAPRRIGITRAHLEEDAGKSMHDEAAGKADTRIDLNRTGTPLLEIVSEPDMRTPAEAKAYLTELKLLLTYLNVSDCNMQEGSLRCDANVNLHIPNDGETIATPIVEIKNMNSFRAVERAIEYEATRQYEEWQESGRKLGDPGVTKRTFGWDDDMQETYPQREKEESSDYRYLPDPDLTPVTLSSDRVEQVRRNLGELPAAIRRRLQTFYELKPHDSEVIVNQGPAFVNYFSLLAESSEDGRRASNWMQQDVLRTLNEQGIGIEEFGVPADSLGELLKIVSAGDLTNSQAKDVFAEMLASGSSPADAMKALGVEKVDSSELEALCAELLQANPHVVADVKDGKQKAIGSLIGQAKKKNPNANPNEVRQICMRLIEGM